MIGFVVEKNSVKQGCHLSDRYNTLENTELTVLVIYAV